MELPQQHPCSWLPPAQSTWEYLHFWYVILASLGRDGIILSRWLRINCCTSVESESRCSLPNVTVVWTTTEGPALGDSEIERCFWKITEQYLPSPHADSCASMKTSLAPPCSFSWNKTGVTTQVVDKKHSEEIQAFCTICDGVPTAVAQAPHNAPRGTSRHPPPCK